MSLGRNHTRSRKTKMIAQPGGATARAQTENGEAEASPSNGEFRLVRSRQGSGAALKRFRCGYSNTTFGRPSAPSGSFREVSFGLPFIRWSIHHKFSSVSSYYDYPTKRSECQAETSTIGVA